MANNKDYYEILGITDEEKKLSSEEFNKICRKKYRNLAMQYHPDKWTNGSETEKKEAEQKFKEIAEANEILSDPQKRQQYDNGSLEFDFDNFNPFEFFSRMSGGFGNYFDSFKSGFKEERVRKGSNIDIALNITLEEAFKGGKFNVQYNRLKSCSHCKGTGSEDGKTTKCPHCNGIGRLTKTMNLGAGSIQMVQSLCPHCNGTGTVNPNPCHKCKGAGTELESATETIEIPKGVYNGAVMSIPNKGNAPKGEGINGDLFIHINVKENDYFKTPDAFNLIHYDDVPFNECLLGFKRKYKTIDGSTVTVDAPELTPHGKAFIFKGKGMYNVNNPNVRGDYAVVINHKLPDKLTKEQKDLLKKF